MSGWGIALLAVGSALAGGMVTGWFARDPGDRSAKATPPEDGRHAEALAEAVRMGLAEQRTVRVLDLRRSTYLSFLHAAEALIMTRQTGAGNNDGRLALRQAFAGVLLQGPPQVIDAANELVEWLREDGHHSLDDLDHAKAIFITAAQAALAPGGTASL